MADADTHAAEARLRAIAARELNDRTLTPGEADALLAALSREQQRAAEAFDYGRASVLEEIVCSVCGSNHDRDESAACEGCVPVGFEEWVAAERQRREQLETAAALVVELDSRERFGDESLSGFEWGAAVEALAAALAAADPAPPEVNKPNQWTATNVPEFEYREPDPTP